MLIIGEGGIRAICEHAQAGYPEEVCGLLLGVSDEGGDTRQVYHVRRARNVNSTRARDRYEVAPEDYLRLTREAQAGGLEIIGIYHSHPDHHSVPSETDRARAAEIWDKVKSWSYLIIEVSSGTAVSWRSWVLENGRFGHEQIQILSWFG